MNALEFVSSGLKLMGESKYAEAKAQFQTALDMRPDLESAWFGLGFIAYQVGDNAAAVSAMNQSICLRAPEDPSSASSYYIRCMAKGNLGDRQGAIHDYKVLCTLNSDLAKSLGSQTCVGASQVHVLARQYPAQFVWIINLLTCAELPQGTEM